MKPYAYSLIALLLCSAGGLILSCEEQVGDSFSTSQEELSGLGFQERRDLRWVMHSTLGGPSSASDILALVEQMGQGAKDYFVSPYASESAVVKDRQLDLTSGALFPRLDAAGNFVQNGGWDRFVEVAHRSDGAVLAKAAVYKPTAQYLSGAISDYTYVQSTESQSSDSTRKTLEHSFLISQNLQFQRLAWNQQAASTRQQGPHGEPGLLYGETYKYQTHPLLKLTLTAGDRYQQQQNEVQSLDGIQGWSVDRKQETQVSLNGTLTLFRPIPDGAERNTNPAGVQVPQIVGRGGLVTETTQATEEQVSDESVNEFLVRHTRKTSTVTQSVTTTKTLGAPVSMSRIDHETLIVTYHVVPGQADKAAQAMWDTLYQDYEETTKSIHTTEYTLPSEPQEGYQVDEVILVYRYTDNPLTRNDLWRWRSTSQVLKEVGEWDEAADVMRTRYEDSGEEWLVDRYEPDPDFNDVPFQIQGTWSDGDSQVVRFLGPDSSGAKTTNSAWRALDMLLVFNDYSFTVRGSLETNQASIQNGTGLGFQTGNDVDGTVRVGTPDGTYLLSAEEWLLLSNQSMTAEPGATQG